VTNRIVRELTGIGSENVVKQAFIDLKDRKMIEPVPGKRGSASAWRKYSGAIETSSDEESSPD
jgi:ATP-dependent DNA helicase RecG